MIGILFKDNTSQRKGNKVSVPLITSMNCNIKLLIISLIFYFCGLADGTQNTSRFVRQVDRELTAPNLCQTKDFSCLLGGCIRRADVCNGIPQCTDKSDESPQACECGVSSIDSLLLEPDDSPGQDVEPGTNPWLVGIYRTRTSNHHNLLCTGAIIYNEIVLTSANCVYDLETRGTLKPSSIFIAAGKLKKDFNTFEPNQQKFTVSHITIMNRYEGDTKNFARNLAIIRLGQRMNRTDHVRPICLWDSKKFPSGLKHGTITGWSLPTKDNYSTNLRQTKINLMDIGDCVRTFNSIMSDKYLTHDKFCFTLDSGADLDRYTGGPVTIYYKMRHYLVGIVSARVMGIDFGIATKTSKHMDWIRNTTYNFKLKDGCYHERHFHCDAQCIRMDQVCDGTKDCSDGSDEDAFRCTTALSPIPAKTTTQAATIELSDTSFPLGKKCVIPDTNVKLEAIKCPRSSTCTSEFFAPSFSTYNATCPEGHGFNKNDNENVLLVCNDGVWFPPIDEYKCLPHCPAILDKSLHLECFYLGTTVSCDKPLRPTTEVHVRCQREFKQKPLVKYTNRTVCRRDGIVEHELSECIPVCGVLYDLGKSQPLISNAEELKYPKYPWHVAVYWRQAFFDDIFKYDYKCGGTLIDPDKVLTAAHCVWNLTTNTMVDSEDLAVASGKLHSSWWVHDNWEQKVRVLKVIPGPHYNGAKAKHSQDIAVLLLKDEFPLSDFMMPACLDLDFNAGGLPQNYKSGNVVGWGAQTDDSGPANILHAGAMKFLDLDSCRKQFGGYEFDDYLQTDKFCALYINGTGTQMGDSGGGFTFLHDNLHYIYGVVSIKKQGQNDFSVFTNVLTHRSWLKNIIANEGK